MAENDPATFELDGGPRDRVVIDGRSYDMTRITALSLRGRARVARLAKRLNELEGLAEPTDAQDAEYREKSRETAAIALPDAPLATVDALSDEQLDAVVTHFFVRNAAHRLARIRQASGPEIPTGTTSSPDSNGSTGETPSDG